MKVLENKFADVRKPQKNFSIFEQGQLLLENIIYNTQRRQKKNTERHKKVSII